MYRGLMVILLIGAIWFMRPLNSSVAAQKNEEMDFAASLAEFHTIKDMLPAHVNRLAQSLLDERQQKIARLATPQEIAERKIYIRERMERAVGGFPARTPLNPRVVGVIERQDYKIEKVIFESQPGFYVTANLYLPKKGRAPYPGILFPLGHEPGGKAYPVWQQMLGAFAKKGYVALTWDPVGQGERVQFYDADFAETKLTYATTEHTMLGIQCLLAGDNMARYTIWDGLRALDYLASRPEVDATRIGCTGNSGGGTHTAYLSALDDRIQVAAPSCYVTSWRRLLQTIGPQDAEQVLLPWLREGLEQADFIHAFAPKPYFILSAIRDFFAISGSRESYTEVKRSYAVLGASDNLSMFEADDEHGYSKPRRLVAYRWFSRWLKGVEDQEPEPEVEIADEEELRCTTSGQLATSLEGETVFSLNRKRVAQLKQKKPPLTKAKELPAYQEEIRQRVKQASHFELLKAPVETKFYGEIARTGYRIKKLVYESEPGIIIPSLLFVPDTTEARKPAVLYVHGRGKAIEANPGGELEQLVRTGFIVLAIDLRGVGETRIDESKRDGDFLRYFGNYDDAMTALLVDKPLVGMRAQDICRGVDLLSAQAEVDGARIYGFGKESGAVPLLYAATLDQRLKKMALEEMLISYQWIIANRIHRQVFEQVVAGALKYYDFADLVSALAPRSVWLVNTVNGLGQQVGIAEVSKQYEGAQKAFRLADAETSLRIAKRKSGEGIEATYKGLLERER